MRPGLRAHEYVAGIYEGYIRFTPPFLRQTMSFDGHFLNSHGVIHEQEGNGSTES